MLVLALDSGGIPRRWIDIETAIMHHARGTVVWSLGEEVAVYRGGHNAAGIQSQISTNSIIAVRGDIHKLGRVALTNRSLFARDSNMCGYCGNVYGSSNLSRDHILAKCNGGKDVWTNVVTSCLKCNLKKGGKRLEHTNMKLLYVPYEPNHYESLILQNRNILADQMQYLLAGVSKNSRIANVDKYTQQEYTNH